MPRQGVPYPSREICSLKCQIDALQRQINELMKSVNGVEGDGQGNVSLISGDPAVVINNDAVQNQIEISLDTSQLPAADVSSVNGQTGAVDLDGADIPLNPGQSTPTVQNAVAANAGNISQLQADLNQEIIDRGNADSALQSNINAVSAGIPAAAAAAVAADPTVAQLAVDVPNKLDKITSGSALKAYTHTGATQGEKSVVDGTTADSIAIRDANGRLQAADPASGATDKTLTTANWVSQTGDSAPNNIAHRSGAETWYGPKKLDNSVDAVLSNSTTNDNGNGTAGAYKVIMKIPLNVTYGARNHILIGVTTRQRGRSFDLLSLYIATSSPQDLTMVLRGNTTENYTYVLSYDADYAYISIVTLGSLSDSIQTMIIGATSPIYNRFPFCTISDIYANVPGTELRRITP